MNVCVLMQICVCVCVCVCLLGMNVCALNAALYVPCTSVCTRVLGMHSFACF